MTNTNDVTIGEVIAAFRKAVVAQDIHSTSRFGDTYAEMISMRRVETHERNAERILNSYIDQRIESATGTRP